MSSYLNWKWGETCPISAKVASAVSVEIGDLLWLDTNGYAQPASTFAKDTDLAGTQAAFAQKFLGVAMQSSPSGITSSIRVATTGTFEFSDDTANSVTELLGTYVGPNLNTATTYLKSGSIVTVTSARLAIARVVHRENIPSGKAFVAIRSTVVNGGVPGSDPTHTTT